MRIQVRHVDPSRERALQLYADLALERRLAHTDVVRVDDHDPVVRVKAALLQQWVHSSSDRVSQAEQLSVLAYSIK